MGNVLAAAAAGPARATGATAAIAATAHPPPVVMTPPLIALARAFRSAADLYFHAVHARRQPLTHAVMTTLIIVSGIFRMVFGRSRFAETTGLFDESIANREIGEHLLCSVEGVSDWLNRAYL